MQVMVSLFQLAAAAPVVWTEAPSRTDQALLESVDGYDGTTSIAELLMADTSDADKAYRVLADALRDVRAYETKLDGELIIMADLQAAIDGISIVRDATDRDALFKALAYQGFAVQRYFDDTLGDDPQAEPWRVLVADQPTVRPWRDAVALSPERDITAYDISEAPQRVAFTTGRELILDALPGGLRADLPDGAELFLDGKARPTDGTTYRLPPGRHYVHVVLDGQVVHAAPVDLTGGGSDQITLDVDVAALRTFVATVGENSTVPGELSEFFTSSGPLWIARPGPKGPAVFQIDGSVSEVSVKPAKKDDDGGTDGLSISGTLGGGWFSSGDFYTSAFDVAPNTAGTVNSAALALGLGASYDLGLFRVGLGIDGTFTPGAFHTARAGETAYRLRPAPHVFVGTRFGGVTAGYLLPHHPFGGLRASIPLPAGLEATADARVGFPSTLTRNDGSTYDTLPVYTILAGLTYRFRL